MLTFLFTKYVIRSVVQNGAVMKKIFQPCEAHIPYILQFMIDFNLQGMNYIHLKSALARRVPGKNLKFFKLFNDTIRLIQ